jgi:TetR/AcrR family transcriptional regulator
LSQIVKETVSEYVTERRRQQRAVDTRKRILEVAYSEFAELGYEGTSTRTIAAKAGVQHPLVTYHFKSKEGLWRAVFVAVGSSFSDQWKKRLTELDDRDDVTKLRLIQEDFIRFAAANPGYHWLMSNEGSRPGERLNWIVENRAKSYFKTIAKLIRSAQRAGRYVDGNPYHLQYLFIGAVTRILMQSAEAEQVMGLSPFSPKFIESHIRACCALFFRDAPSSSRQRAQKPRRAGLGTTRKRQS